MVLALYLFMFDMSAYMFDMKSLAIALFVHLMFYFVIAFATVRI